MGGQGGLFYLTRRGAPPISRNQPERVGVGTRKDKAGGGDKGGWETDTESVEEGAEGAWWEMEPLCLYFLASQLSLFIWKYGDNAGASH